jgi:uncharacterized repeat protein (TIGR01451 family)
MALHWVKMAKVQWEWGRLMRAYRIQKRKTATRHGSKKNSLQTHKRSSKTNLVKTFSFLTLVLLLSSSLLVIGSVGYGQQQDPIISGDENTGQYTATWTFDNSSKFTTTQTEIATSQVTLQSDNYNWTQSTKNDFDLGKHDNITVLTSSEAEIIKEEDFENGTGGWQHGILDGQVDDWQYGQISQVPEFIRVGSPSFKLWCTELDENYSESGSGPSDIFLLSPSIDLSGSGNTEMSFWHFYDFESDFEKNDGGRVEISTDSGISWEDIPYPGYTGRIEAVNNPLYNEFCFTGNSSGWIEEEIDLSNFDGENEILIRFRFATNGQVADWGWYIDDIEITSNTISDGEVELLYEDLQVGDETSQVVWDENETIINTDDPIPSDGFLTKWTVIIEQNGTGKLKLFREEGDSFLLVDETELLDFEDDKNEYDWPIEVMEGDYIGWYGKTAKIWVLEGSAYNMSGDIDQDTQKSQWNSINRKPSILVKGIQRHGVGIYTSPVFDALSRARWGTISWSENISTSNTDIVLQTRTGGTIEPDGGTWSPWYIEYTISSGSNIKPDNTASQYIQFRAILSTVKQPITPSLQDVTISYSKYSPSGEVETDDLAPEVIVQWEQLVKSEELNSESIDYFYSLDSGLNWSGVPSNGDMRGISVLEGKIRFKAVLSTDDTTMTPALEEMSLQYSSARPDMQIELKVDKNTVNPGDTVTFTIIYSNVGKGNAIDVNIAFFMDANLSYRDDTSGENPEIPEENVRLWQFGVMEKTSRSFLIDTKVKDIDVDTKVSVYAVLTFSDIGGNSYQEVTSNIVTIDIERGPDILFIISMLALVAAIIAVLLYFIIARHRRIAAEKADLTETGIGYLIMEENPKKSYDLFKKLIESGQSGLCITRSFPHRVRSMYGIEDIPILWLSRAKDPNSIIPTNLGGMLRHAKVFMEEHEDSVVLLDGLEYLMVHNDFSRVLKLVHGLNELAAINAGRVIIPMNPLTMDDDKVALLKRDLKELGKMAI